MVWETREVREKAITVSPPFTHLPCHVQKALGHALPTLYAGTRLTLCFQISTMHPDPALPLDNTPFPYDTNAYPGRRSSAAPFSPASHTISQGAWR